MKRSVYLHGSSAVGKSTIAERMVEEQGYEFNQIRARDVHQKHSDFSFDKMLESVNYARSKQAETFEAFTALTQAMARKAATQGAKPQVSERTIMDVPAYTTAYFYQHSIDMGYARLADNDRLMPFLTKQLRQADQLFLDAITSPSFLVTVPICPSVPYHNDGARPPETIRDLCDGSTKFTHYRIDNHPANRLIDGRKKVITIQLEAGNLDTMYQSLLQEIERHEAEDREVWRNSPLKQPLL